MEVKGLGYFKYKYLVYSYIYVIKSFLKLYDLKGLIRLIWWTDKRLWDDKTLTSKSDLQISHSERDDGDGYVK